MTLGDGDIVSPCTAVITVFENVSEMPKKLKNDKFTIKSSGIPDYEQYEPHPCFVHYLSPADYHCFHAPVGGKIAALVTQTDGPYSVTVKPYVFKHINILERNRRVVVVIERDDGFRVAMVIIGGITVDSIRLESGLTEGARIAKGAKIGAFARGGSSIAMFFSRPVSLEEKLNDVHTKGFGFKVAVNENLVRVADR